MPWRGFFGRVTSHRECASVSNWRGILAQQGMTEACRNGTHATESFCRQGTWFVQLLHCRIVIRHDTAAAELCNR